MQLWFCVCLIYSISGYASAENPRVTTSLGDVEGGIIKSLLGKSIYSFRGIRYAQAPTGDLRFQPPVPVEKWTGVYNATVDGPMCPQPILRPISEDCLSLSVYTTELPTKRHNPKRPVLFFIHPGGFYSMTSASNWAGPQYFIDQDVVMVVINYRLGSLGYMSTGDNIAAFGGDPNLVTIVGYSAGGISVTAHLLSSMSRGLFHRAIAMSDTVFGQWPIGNHQLNLAQKQARLLGCPDDTSEKIVTCLKTKSAEELGESLRGFAEYGFDPVLLWTPVVEPDFGQERFLTEHPLRSVLRGDFAKVPIIAGITDQEFSYIAAEVFANPKLLEEMDKDFDRVAPIAFVYERNTTRSLSISSELRRAFLGNGPLTDSDRTGLGHLYADGLVGFGVHRGVKLLSAKNTECTYYYKFSYQGRYSHVKLPNSTVPYGVVHHDDLIYLFYISQLFPKFNVTDPEYTMVRKLTTMWTNFAITGNPTPHHHSEPLGNAHSIPYTPGKRKYMDIGNELSMKQNLYEERYSVWDKLFPLNAYQ
ncbi:venom carboxylesterase-6-like isoform X2 [Photinus pyralis]|uniref:venom carboxylesterase-6-like isoform X2 n=1 Tax=Photinus pyralis TaxID=7054 RepID=UPI0012676B21|nr:venom carboxylesterase-6-like isoform X2 [Photinus pyralis]